MGKAIILSLCAILILPSLLFAQTYDLKIYAVGASAPQQTYTLPVFQCGQLPPSTPGPNVNPTTLAWIDPANSSLICLFRAGPVDSIFSQPIGSYEATLTLTTDAGTSAESARAPFFVKALPAAPTGLRFSR